MAWIGQRDALGGVFNPTGLDQPFAECDPAMVLQRGSVMLEYRYPEAGKPLNLLRYMTRDPAPAALTLRSDPCGSLSVMMRKDDEDVSFSIGLNAPQPDEPILVRLSWDCETGRSILSATLMDRGVHVIEELDIGLGYSQADARQMMMTTRAVVDPAVTFVALSDEVIPVGTMPGLDGQARLKTAEGHLMSVADLRPGQLLLAADGAPAQLRWSGSVTLPAMGRFAPVRLRAPYFGASRDLDLGGHQTVQVSGTEVEYLFAETDVAVRMHDLVDGRTVTPAAPGPVVTYHHLIIDRPVAIDVEGVVVPGLDVRPMLADPLLAAHSVLSDFPNELIPRADLDPCAPLRAFEAQTLSRMRAA